MLQLERDRGAWDDLSPDARREKESSLQMFGQLGRFHNIMSNETIGTLAFLTSGERDHGNESMPFSVCFVFKHRFGVMNIY